MPNFGAFSSLSSGEGFGSLSCSFGGSSLSSAGVNTRLLTQLQIPSSEDEETWGLSSLCPGLPVGPWANLFALCAPSVQGEDGDLHVPMGTAQMRGVPPCPQVNQFHPAA